CTCRMPRSAALRAAASAATCAANGVPLRDPLKPHDPALDQTSTFPCGSLTVMIVLLNVEWMWSTPSATSRFAFLRRAGAASGAAGFPPLDSCCFAPGPPCGDSPLRTQPLEGGAFFPATVRPGPLRCRAFVC